MRKRIGLVLHNIHEEYSVELIKGVKRFCKENSIQLILFPINSKLSPFCLITPLFQLILPVIVPPDKGSLEFICCIILGKLILK